MSVAAPGHLEAARPKGRGLPPAVADARPQPATDSWPGTVRVMPWLVAGFLVMLWLVPFNAVTLPIPSPVDSLLDRFVLPIIGLVWFLMIFLGGRAVRPHWRPTGIDTALAIFLAVTLFSVIHNLEVLVPIGEFGIAMKKIWLLLGYASIFLIVGSVVRHSELRSFSTLFVVLGSLTAIGVIYEYRTGVNVFYDWTRQLLPPAISVGQPPPDPLWGRESIVGPTDHAIAIGTMLAMSLAFALTGLMQASTRKSKALHALAATLMLAACFSTIRKTGFVAPITALTALLIMRPRSMFKLLPLGVVMIFVIQGTNPGVISRIKSQFLGGGGFFENKSVTGRTDDYGPSGPDLLNNLAFGRGHGSYDPDRYRFLDNEYLARIIETGLVGLAAYLLLILVVIRVAYRASRCADPDRARVGVAVVAGVAVYLAMNLVFDALSFPQAPYMLFFLAGLAVVAAPPAKPFRPTFPAPARKRAADAPVT